MVELREAFGLAGDDNRLSVCLAHLKKMGRVVHANRGDPWSLRGPAQANKSMKMRLADEEEDLFDWLASASEPQSNAEIGKHFGWAKSRVLKRLWALRRSKRVEIVGGGNHRRWTTSLVSKPRQVDARFSKMAKRATRDRQAGRGPFSAGLDDQLRARLADIDRERDAILVLLETHIERRM